MTQSSNAIPVSGASVEVRGWEHALTGIVRQRHDKPSIGLSEGDYEPLVRLSDYEQMRRERDAFETGLVQMHTELSAAEAELLTLRATKGELVEALRPFAAYAWSLRSRRDGDHEIGWMGLNEHGEHAAVDIAVRDFRAARTALSCSGVSKI